MQQAAASASTEVAANSSEAVELAEAFEAWHTWHPSRSHPCFCCGGNSSLTALLMTRQMLKMPRGLLRDMLFTEQWRTKSLWRHGRTVSACYYLRIQNACQHIRADLLKTRSRYLRHCGTGSDEWRGCQGRSQLPALAGLWLMDSLTKWQGMFLT